MIEDWKTLCGQLGDAAFGWLLWSQRDFAVVVVSVILALAMLAVRRVLTNQIRIRQIEADERRIRELIHDARTGCERGNLARYCLIRRYVAGQRARTELASSCALLIILSVVLQWGQLRLNNLPVPTGVPVRFVARFPLSAVGEVVHLVPQDGMTAEDGWIRVVYEAANASESSGRAEWTLRFTALDSRDTRIALRFRQHCLLHTVLLGEPWYAASVQSHAIGTETELLTPQYRPFGIVPSHLQPGIPGWSLLMASVTGGILLVARLHRGLPSRRLLQNPSLPPSRSDIR